MLSGKTAVITGSTSGMGLGIAQSLAAFGANIVLNGFGDPKAIEETRAKLARDTTVGVVYSAADMSKPDRNRSHDGSCHRSSSAASISSSTMPASSMSIRSRIFPPTNGTRSSPLRCPPRSMPPASSCPSMKRQNWGRIINIASAPVRSSPLVQIGLCRRQAWPRRLDQDGRARSHRPMALPSMPSARVTS